MSFSDLLTRMALLSLSTEFHVQRGVKVVNGLDQSDTAYLEQIVHIFIAVGKPFDHAEHQPQVSFDILLSGFLIPFFYPLKQLRFFFIGKHRKL